MEDKIIDQSPLAQEVSDKIPYEFMDMFLIKQLDPIKVKKEFSEPITNNIPTKDSDGIEAVDFEDVKTEIKEVNSEFRKGVVLKVPMSFKNMDNKPFDIKVGDVILFKDTMAQYFDLLKDSRLCIYYHIVAICK